MKKEKKLYAFIAKYALTTGIYEVEGYWNESSPDHFCVLEKQGLWTTFSKNEWFITRDEAVLEAEKRRLKKIDSFKNQIKKLESLCF